jgi:3-hydroxyisobutyrate dehydrogenase
MPQTMVLSARIAARRLTGSRWFGHLGSSRAFWTTTPAIHSRNYNVGFVGLGNMGLPMALKLLDEALPTGTNDSVELVAFDSNLAARNNAQSLSQGRVRLTESASKLASDNKVDAIFTMLTNDDAVDIVMNQFLEGITQRAEKDRPCIIDCSTISPSKSLEWHEKWKTHGLHMFDAPVSGGVKGATAGTLTFMVGGDPCDAAQQSLNEIVRPLMMRMGSNVLLCGGPGTGSATKLCNNLALAAQMVGICEALNLGEALGVDPLVLTQVMNVSTAACWSSKVNNPHPVVAAAMDKETGLGPPACRDYQGGFGASLMLKDLTLAINAAKGIGVAVPVATTTQELYDALSAKGRGGKDFSVMLEYLKSMPT